MIACTFWPETAGGQYNMEDNSKDALSPETQDHRLLTILGWVISIVGGGFYIYGYFASGGATVVNWPGFMPEWASAFVPTWQAELGLTLSIIGGVPLFYVEYRKI